MYGQVSPTTRASGPPTSSAFATALAVDPAGNTYVTGSFYGTITFGSTVLRNENTFAGNVFVAKRTAAGQFLWAVQAGGRDSDAGQSIAVDQQGNVYVTGAYYNWVATFGSYELPNVSGANAFVAKLSAEGEWQWAVRAGGNGSHTIKGLALDSRGNAYITGYFEGFRTTFGPSTLENASQQPSDEDLFVAKLDAWGRWQWGVRAGGTGDDRASGVAIDAQDRLHLVGYFDSPTAEFGSIRVPNGGLQNILVACLDTTGQFRWATAGGGSNQDWGTAIAADGQGNSYITGGFFSASATFGATTLYKVGLAEVVVAKLDAQGQWVWAQRGGGSGPDQGIAIAADKQGNAYVTGVTGSPYCTFGLEGVPQLGEYDVFVAKMASTSGECLWLRNAGGVFSDHGAGIAVDPRGRVYVAGYFEQTADFGPLHLETEPNAYASFLAQIPNTTVLATATPKSSPSLVLWPSPTRTSFQVRGGAAGEQLTVQDARGRHVLTHTLGRNPSEQVYLPPGTAPGVYFLRVGQSTTRFLVE
ncbi:SBBP repeat-containing protein [Hymenobacter wooponensis]|nr:SBBP repeat-containing protein [Hymenobacter wooponensis]